MMEPFEEKMRRGGAAAIHQIGRFFMEDDPVHLTLNKIAKKLNEIGVPYAIVGGMALGQHGFVRATVDVNILVTPEGLALIHQRLDGLGYLPPFSTSKNLRDTETGIKIKFLTTGGFPGDGKPKPVTFPEPASCSVEVEGVKYISLPGLIELKLASGMTSLLRLKDLADVIALIQNAKLSKEFSDKLNPCVRDKYIELWTAAQESDPLSEE